MIHINDITYDLYDKCRSIMNKLESGNIYLGKYKENIVIVMKMLIKLIIVRPISSVDNIIIIVICTL